MSSNRSRPSPSTWSGAGYVREEFFVSGTASAFEAAGPLQPDGRWSVTSGDSAEYRTRIVVRRPSDGARFNGTVLVEWFNVSSGGEGSPDWTYLGPQILRDGYAYVGVSAQKTGVEGGTALVGVPGLAPNLGLRTSGPERYETLHHPGDMFCFDMFSQIGRALRASGPGCALGPLVAERIVAVGESQSAFFLTTYINAVHPLAGVYDGYLVHSRGEGGASLGGIPMASPDVPTGVQIRSDVDVPVFVFETETDVGPRLNFGPARQADSDRIRTWEVAGTAHGDAYVVGGFTSFLGCDFRVNEGPQHFVAQAALVALDQWVRNGVAPPTAPPLLLSKTDPAEIARDPLGNAIGGVRTPAVDVPVSALSGEAPPARAGCARCSARLVPSRRPSSWTSTATRRGISPPSKPVWTPPSRRDSSSRPTAPNFWPRRNLWCSQPGRHEVSLTRSGRSGAIAGRPRSPIGIQAVA